MAAMFHHLSMEAHQAASQPAQLDRRLLLQLLIAVVPALTCVGLAKPEFGSKWFFFCLLLFLARYAIKGDRFGFMTLLVGTVPAFTIFRGLFFYSSVVTLFAAGVLMWLLIAPDEVRDLFSDLRLKGLLVFATAYWIVSYYLTEDYSSNLRVMELVFCAIAICLLVNRWIYLSTAFLSIGLSSAVMGLAFLPYGDRLGSGEVGGVFLGNPISFGIPITLILILTIADNGRWLGLEHQKLWRIALALFLGAWLVLSTSRGSWSVILANGLVLAVINRQQRKMLLLLVAILVIVTIIVLASSRGEDVKQSFDRTVSSERTLSNSTSGRSDQWWLFPQVFSQSPLWGFGPGSGGAIYARYSNLFNMFHSGEEMAWHSLYMQIGIETGLLGLLLLSIMLVSLVGGGIAHWRFSGDTVPLQGALSFIIIGMSVTGFDAASGLFLGLSLLSGRWHPASAAHNGPIPSTWAPVGTRTVHYLIHQ
jgi:O-antigen ligase